MSAASHLIYILYEMSLSQSRPETGTQSLILMNGNVPNQNSISKIHEWAMVPPEFQLGLGFVVGCLQNHQTFLVGEEELPQRPAVRSSSLCFELVATEG
jgi:hypothetical protein